MSSMLALVDATLDLTVVTEEILDREEDRKWRAKKSLSMNKAMRQERDRKRAEKERKDKAERKASYKEANRQASAVATPPLDVRFDIVSGLPRPMARVYAPDLKVTFKGQPVVFLVLNDELATRTGFFEEFLRREATTDDLASSLDSAPQGNTLVEQTSTAVSSAKDDRTCGRQAACLSTLASSPPQRSTISPTRPSSLSAVKADVFATMGEG